MLAQLHWRAVSGIVHDTADFATKGKQGQQRKAEAALRKKGQREREREREREYEYAPRALGEAHTLVEDVIARIIGNHCRVARQLLQEVHVCIGVEAVEV